MKTDLTIARRFALAVGACLVVACAGGAGGRVTPQATDRDSRPGQRGVTEPEATIVSTRDPSVEPRIAMLRGLLPLASLGVDTFLLRHPLFDGRGVLIGILDSGVDPGVPGLTSTTTGQPKVLDLRDFSGEGRIELVPLDRHSADTVIIGGRAVVGVSRIARLASRPYYGGTLRELPLGKVPESDLNGNGTGFDEFSVLVARSSSGWFAVTDTDRDGSFEDERPIRDYGEGRETFSLPPSAMSRRQGPTTIAVNLTEDEQGPVLDFVFDNSSHGTHVAGVAAGHNLFGVEGFNGVAPGAQILGVKISNNARGGMSVTGSMLRGMNYAADYAQRRNLPLVLNLSFGVGNELEGAAGIDSLVNEFALKHPNVLFVISAGNDGPGVSTVGFPGTAHYALSVCGLFPGTYASLFRVGSGPLPDDMAGFSARGGEAAKPDVCAPGYAFSVVPQWKSGEEIQAGTSFAAPQISGLAALLQSALMERGRRARAIDLTRALSNTATRPEGTTVLDAGAGIPNAAAAYRWLMASHQAGVYSVRALPSGGNTSTGSAAYRRSGLASSADTLQRFEVTSVAGQPAARLLLRPDADWLHAPPVVEPAGEPAVITLRYDAGRLVEPGLHVGTVSAVSATDTMAGASFELVNTVVVPYDLDRAFVGESSLRVGGTDRYFFRVPDGAGGLEVTLSSRAPVQGAELHLFEPSGQPHRGRRSRIMGVDDPRSVSMLVRAEDLVPGVYEAVVLASPAEGISYTLEAELPPLDVIQVDDGPITLVRNRSDTPVRADVTARTVGIVATRRAAASGSQAYTLRVEQPGWANELEVDVALPSEYWNRLTDFGVTVFDTLGSKLTDSPQNYAFGRQVIALDSLSYDGDLVIELLPAYAHLEPETSWEGGLRVSFTLPDHLELVNTDSVAPVREIAPGEVVMFRFSLGTQELSIPIGFDLLVEVGARGSEGPLSVRRGSVRLAAPLPGS